MRYQGLVQGAQTERLCKAKGFSEEEDLHEIFGEFLDMNKIERFRLGMESHPEILVQQENNDWSDNSITYADRLSIEAHPTATKERCLHAGALLIISTWAKAIHSFSSRLPLLLVS